MALFVTRARAAKASFPVTGETLRTVAEICIRLDGLPLAIELAASRARVLEPREILARLEQRQPLLTTGAANVPPRQRTLRDAIEWSYELLQPGEQALFTRLAIFAGGCTLEAAGTVCNAGDELGLDTFDGMASLVEQNLVQRSGEAGESRFHLLETIREYAHDRLVTAAQAGETGRRHLEFYRDLGEIAEPHFMESDREGWIDRIERENANVRAALGNALEAGKADDGLRLASALWRFWFQKGFMREGRTWLEALLALEPDAVSATRARALTALGGLTYWLSDADATERAYESAARLYRAIGDRGAEAQALYDLAFVPAMRHDADETRRRIEAGLGLAREVGRPDLVAQGQAHLGIRAAMAGDPQAALAFLDEAAGLFPRGRRPVAPCRHARQRRSRLSLAGELRAGAGGIPRSVAPLDRDHEPAGHRVGAVGGVRGRVFRWTAPHGRPDGGRDIGVEREISGQERLNARNRG